MNAYTSTTTKPLYKATQIVQYLAWILEGLLAFRFLLRLFQANPAAGFTDFIYSITYPFVAPFFRVFQITDIDGNIFEWTTLLAMVVYWLLALAIIRLLVMGKPVSTTEAATRLNNHER